ncbi:MAG TPA: hypothetical protein VL096_20420, partial [Pirellulaceae bacterium]|nr:hypothetical protein [Pirellulaceae bacterium]
MKTYLTLIAFVLFSAISSLASADAPRVRFDAPQTLAVRDVTSPEFAFVHPDERMIEARLTISLLLERGAASDIREVIHRLESSTSAAQVVDYSPKTQLATQIIGSTN